MTSNTFCCSTTSIVPSKEDKVIEVRERDRGGRESRSDAEPPEKFETWGGSLIFIIYGVSLSYTVNHYPILL